MQSNTLEPLLKKARELEKKYKWLEATEYYQEASDFALDRKDLRKSAEIEERISFCFRRAAFQVQTNFEFRKCMKRSIQVYKKASKILKEAEVENKEARIENLTAWVAYVSSLLEKNPLKKKKLLDEWWTLENRVLSVFEHNGKLRSAGKVCNDILEYSSYGRYWFASNFSEKKKVRKESYSLAEKAIQILSKVDDTYELARAYCNAGWYYSLESYGQSDAEIRQSHQKCSDYSKKALELSLGIGEAWLIGQSYLTAYNSAIYCKLNPALAATYCKKAVEYGKITKDHTILGRGNVFRGHSIMYLAKIMEDPDKQKESFRKALKMAQESLRGAQITHFLSAFWVIYTLYSDALTNLASIETDFKTKQEFFELATNVIQEGMERLRGWRGLQSALVFHLSENLYYLSKTKSEIEEKRTLLLKAQHFAEKYVAHLKEMNPYSVLYIGKSYFHLVKVQNDLAKIETNDKKRIRILRNTATLMEKSIELSEKKEKFLQSTWIKGVLGQGYTKLGSILKQIYSITRDKKALSRAVEVYKIAGLAFEKAGLPVYIAESYWQLAQLNDLLDEWQKASQNYESASKAYVLATEKIPQLEEYYKNYSVYMSAWSQIEQARYTHSIGEYDKANEHYKKAAKLNESTEPWSYLASNYFAWAILEEAEGLSRNEDTQKAKQKFTEALKHFNEAEESIKQRISEIKSIEEKEINLELLKDSKLRGTYSQTRNLIEEAKLLDRKGKYMESSKRYEEGAKIILSIIDKIESEAERKELEYLSILCQAWGKMAMAEETTSSESYLEAATLFKKAKEHCYTKKASLWALGNSNFCRGLAAGVEYQTLLKVKDHNKAKGYIQNAATNYFKAGYRNASEYAKATLRLFDAYLFMNQAERESDTEKRVKKYQLAENLLQLASSSFIEAQQPEKTTQVKQILENVKAEKNLAISFNEVLQAPSIASTTQSFAAPTPTSEVSVGLEQFQHANVQANLIASLKEVKVGESFYLTVEFVNAGKEPALLTRVEDFVPPNFTVVKKPEIYRLEDSCLNMKGKQIAPLKLVEAKLTLQPSKKGIYQLEPKVHYLDELGQSKSLSLKSVEIKVEEVILADRVSTGTKELDSLLLGGFPEEYAVVLTGSPSDEREMLIKNFLEAGIEMDGASFYVTVEADGLERLLEKSGFYLFLCNLRPKVEVPDLPNVYKLHGKTDLNNLGIALVKAYRKLSKKPEATKKICVQILSDVLVNYGSKTARKWISELITDLCSKGFTMLAVMDPEMHPADQSKAVLNLFDGEISITQAEDPLECKKSVIVKKLRNQDFIKNSIYLTKSR